MHFTLQQLQPVLTSAIMTADAAVTGLTTDSRKIKAGICLLPCVVKILMPMISSRRLLIQAQSLSWQNGFRNILHYLH
jgi:hypothetical protein